MNNSKKIGLIGLGDMGYPIACNLMKSGYCVTGYDIDSEKLDRFVSDGGNRSENIPELVGHNDIILTLLPSSDLFVSVANEYLIPNARAGQLFIEIGTTVPKDIKDVAEKLKLKSANLLDAPVSGGTEGAKKAKLKMFVGGDQHIYEMTFQVLSDIAGPETIVYCGSHGSGQAMKGVNQLIMGLQSAACLEILSFAVHTGLDLELIGQVFPEKSNKQIVSMAEKITAGHGNEIGVKFRELPYYIRQAHELGYELPITKRVYEFCDKGERVVVDDHREAPSFWNELLKKVKEQ